MGALAGIRVIELAGMGPTPFCGMMLGDMGADVLRVDRLTATGDGIVMSPAADLRGRNKRSVQIDLKHPEGLEILKRLIAEADILLEGYRPGVTERMGIGPEVCLLLNPKLVYARATGWGQEGPLAMTAGHDINYLALTGALAMIGTEERPVPPLNLLGDLGGGALYMAVGVLAALNAARTTGKGQVVDAAMIDGVSSLLTVSHGRRQHGGYVPGRAQNILDGGAPYYRCYQTRDAKFMAVGAIEGRFYKELLQGLALDPQALPDRNKRENWPALQEIFAKAFMAQSREHWAEIFAKRDACVSPVLELAEAGQHPHNLARNAFVAQNGTDNPAPAPRFMGTPSDLRLPPVTPGAHSEAALADWGIAAKDIDAGLRTGFIAAARSTFSE